MAGVIDNSGQQWEHCNNCGDWTKIQSLRYEQPSDGHPYGRDLCAFCFNFPKMQAQRRAARLPIHEAARKAATERLRVSHPHLFTNLPAN